MTRRVLEDLCAKKFALIFLASMRGTSRQGGLYLDVVALCHGNRPPQKPQSLATPPPRSATGVSRARSVRGVSLEVSLRARRVRETHVADRGVAIRVL